jgi:hypothetical protein
MQRGTLTPRTILILLAFALAATLGAQDKKEKREEKKKNAADLPAVIWRDPGDVSALDMLNGSGGKEHAPDPDAEYKFLQEDMNGTSPKFDVEDSKGVKWRIKLGQEPQSETAATRLLWAAGYFVDDDYFLAQVKVAGLPKLRRGGNFVSEDGTVRRARLERKPKERKKLGDWEWFHNPFVGTKELNGLRVMMALVNNWDLKAINNSIYAVEGERWYLVSDVGASFGKTGDSMSRSKGVYKDYIDSKFVEKIKDDRVDFVMHSRPFFLTAVNVGNYETRAHMEAVTKDIPREDAKWLGQRLAQLSESQIKDCFRAAGYPPDEVDGYAKEVQKRIAALNAL